MPVSNRDVAAVQRHYPQIYLACHTRHHRRRSSETALTPQESSLLAHLSEDEPVRAAQLARHLGVVASTLSAAIKRLTTLGFIARARDARDGRAAALRLSRQGARAMQDGSVLETRRVAAMLARLAPADRARALDGLALLATAARSLATKEFDPSIHVRRASISSASRSLMPDSRGSASR
jgi:MarR family transcriptional regulator, organic hydroperoxide resistance regulator